MNIKKSANNVENTCFSIEEAISLLGFITLRNVDLDNGPEKIGVVVGILDLNEEIEVLVKYPIGMMQFTKSEFIQSVEIIKE